MFSWFPLFFPFRHPLYLPSGSELEVNVWRLADSRGKKIWYEWSAEAFLPTLTAPPPGTAPPVSPGVGDQRNGGTSPSPSGGLISPLADAQFSPAGFFSRGGAVEGRVKIGQSGLHNAGGVHSWVGL